MLSQLQSELIPSTVVQYCLVFLELWVNMPGFKSSSSIVDKGEGLRRNEVGEVGKAQI